MNTETTPYVGYNYYTETVEGVYNQGIRLKSVRDPSTRLVHYRYGAQGTRDEMITKRYLDYGLDGSNGYSDSEAEVGFTTAYDLASNKRYERNIQVGAQEGAQDHPFRAAGQEGCQACSA